MKGLLKFIGVLLVLVLVLAGGLYAAASIPKKVNTVWTEADLQSYMQKAHASVKPNTGTQIKPAGLEDLLFDNFKSSGSVRVDEVVTAAETTAMVNSVIRGQGIFEDIRIGFRSDGAMEASAYLGKNMAKITELIPGAAKYEKYISLAAGKPVYWRYTLERVDNKTFDAHTVEFRIGVIPLPLKEAGTGLGEVGSVLNNTLKKMDGFECEAMKIDAAGFHFKGSIPDALEYVDSNHPLN